MAEFEYRAASLSGGVERGVVSAPDRRAAAGALARRGLRALEIRAAAGARAPEAEDAVKIRGSEKLSLAFFRKILQLCKGGMPMGDALKSLAQRSLNPQMQALSRELYRAVSEGATLSSAMVAYPKLFEPCIVHLTEAGESTANIVPVFENIVDYLEGKRTLRASVTAALVYPAILCCLAFGVVLLFLFYLMPMIEDMMANLGGEMSIPVKILIAMGDFLIYGGPILLALAALSALAVAKYRSGEEGRLKTDRILARLPLAGPIAVNADICRFGNLIATLYASGVNTTETFRLAEKTVKNSDLRLRFQMCRTAINDGAPISASFKKYGIFDDDDIDILSVGERTGSLVECFMEIKNTHMEILRARIKAATSILTGVALMTAVAIIFLVALGIVSSVFGLSQNLV